MTLPSINLFLGKLLRATQQLAKENGGRVQGPLQTLTKWLQIDDILDDEWKRALALGFGLSLIAFVIALIGNLYDGEKDDANEQTKQSALERWTLKMKASFEENNHKFQESLNKLKPDWWTEGREENVQIATEIYKKLLQNWQQKYSFNTPFALNILLVGMFMNSYPLPTANLKDTKLTNQLLARAHYFLRFADVSYASDLRSAGVLKRSVIKSILGSRKREDADKLRHVLFVDHLAECIVLMIRGTVDLDDMIVNLLSNEENFMDGVSHGGLLAQARVITTEIAPVLDEAISATQYKKFVITGHSLGAGVAVLSSLLFRTDYPQFENIDIDCYTFGAPPVVGPASAFPPDHPVLASVNIYNFVNNDDIIPRTSMCGLELGLKLCTAIDCLKDFTIKDRIEALFKRKIPQEIISKVEEVMEQMISSSSYTEMIVPGNCFWLVPQEGKHFVYQPDSTIIPSQPMFLGDTWLIDHRLGSYKSTLESL